MSTMSKPLFVYGSLMSTKVLQILLNRVPEMLPGVLSHHHRFQIKQQVFPAVLKQADQQVNGLLLLNLTSNEMAILDCFEAEEYERLTHPIQTSAAEAAVDAYVYVWHKADDVKEGLLFGEWDFKQHFEPNESSYIVMCQEFVDEIKITNSEWFS